MDLTIHTADTAPADSIALLEGIADDLGFVPNLAGVAAASPALLAGFDGLRRAVGSGGLDPVLRETAGVAVGVAADNRYGVAFHSTVLGSLGVADDEIATMRQGAEPADPRTSAVYALAREVVLSRGKVAASTSTAPWRPGSRSPTCSTSSPSAPSRAWSAPSTTWPGRVDLDEFLQPRAWQAG